MLLLKPVITAPVVPFTDWPVFLSPQSEPNSVSSGTEAGRQVMTYDGTVLQEPSLVDVADALGVGRLLRLLAPGTPGRHACILAMAQLLRLMLFRQRTLTYSMKGSGSG